MNTIAISTFCILIVLITMTFLLRKIYDFIKDLFFEIEFYFREIDRRDRIRYIDQLHFYCNKAIQEERYEDAAVYKKLLNEEISKYNEEYGEEN